MIGRLVSIAMKKNSKYYTVLSPFTVFLHVVDSVNNVPFMETLSFFGFLVVTDFLG